MIIKFTNLPVAMFDYLMEKGELADAAKYINAELDATDQRWTTKRERAKEKEFLLRLREQDGIQNVRFVGSDRYGIIDNKHIMNWLDQALPDVDKDKALVTHYSNDGDSIHGSLLLPDTMKTMPDSDYGIGIAFSNSEDGTGIQEVMPWLYRAICENGCQWGRRDARYKVSKKHVGDIKVDELKIKIQALVNLALSEGHDLLAQMMLSKDALVNADTQLDVMRMIAYLSKQNNLTLEQGRAWLKAYYVEPTPNAFGFINGLTRAAHEWSGAQRFDMEQIAGDLLARNLKADKNDVIKRWDGYAYNASMLDAKKVEQQYARVLVAA
jgi:hypothetical protein